MNNIERTIAILTLIGIGVGFGTAFNGFEQQLDRIEKNVDERVLSKACRDVSDDLRAAASKVQENYRADGKGENAKAAETAQGWINKSDILLAQLHALQCGQVHN